MAVSLALGRVTLRTNTAHGVVMAKSRPHHHHQRQPRRHRQHRHHHLPQQIEPMRVASAWAYHCAKPTISAPMTIQKTRKAPLPLIRQFQHQPLPARQVRCDACFAAIDLNKFFKKFDIHQFNKSYLSKYILNYDSILCPGMSLRANYQQKRRQLFQIGGRGSEPGLFTWPRGIAVGPDNSIVVADSSNHRVQVFDENGTFIKEFGQYGNSEVSGLRIFTLIQSMFYSFVDAKNKNVLFLNTG